MAVIQPCWRLTSFTLEETNKPSPFYANQTVCKLLQTIKKFLKSPGNFLFITQGLLRGSFYIAYYKLFRRNVRVDFPFFAHSSVTIVGPGSVRIGKNCHVFENVFRGLTIVTLSKKATVIIGERCSLGGVTIRCFERVEIGDDTMTAVSLVQDLLFVNFQKAGFQNEYIPPAKPIFIGNNIWLGGHCCVLGGCKIGNDSVLSACSVTYDIEIKEFSLCAGNPVRRALPIAQILALRK